MMVEVLPVLLLSYLHILETTKKKHTRKKTQTEIPKDDVNVWFSVKPSHSRKHTILHVPTASQPVRNNLSNPTLMSTAAFLSRREENVEIWVHQRDPAAVTFTVKF